VVPSDGDWIGEFVDGTPRFSLSLSESVDSDAVCWIPELGEDESLS